MRTSNLAALLALGALTAAASTFTFKSGVKFEGDVVELKGTNAVVVRSDRDGKLYTLMLTNLTDVDQFLITGHMPDPVAAYHTERERTEAAKTLPEQAPDKSSGSEKIVGAFGLKLGQAFDPNYATSTNLTSDEITLKGDYIRLNMVSYTFKPRAMLMRFDWYSVETTPRSNLVFSVTALADYKSYTSASDDRDKLQAALQQKYGKADVQVHGDTFYYSFEQGTRFVSLSLCAPDKGTPHMRLTYEDSALHQQAKAEQMAIDAADPKRKAEQDKLKSQL